jgi:superfamily II DNA or RNA helicase
MTLSFKEDLRNLITKGILAEPIFEELPTKLEIYRELNPRELKTIQNIDTLPKDIAQKIAESSLRNNRIVEHYIQNQEKYKQLVVFAIDIVHALALNTLFIAKGISSEYVLSDFKDSVTGATISSAKENPDKIQKFRATADFR